tara:strand:+ start:50 stop:367 length:318 start_codon:yes stop_codon:yes gene_type:complete
MVNRLYNKQVSPKGYMKGGRVKKMGGGMMKRKMLKSGSSKPDFLDLDKDNNTTETMKSAAKSLKKTSGGMRANKKEKAGMKAGMKRGVSKLNEGLRKFLEKKGKK